MIDGSRLKKKAARPKDASTLVLYKMRAGKPCVLMGLRNSRHKFMPDQYVFPGGRVDRRDGFVPAASELQNHVMKRLIKAASPHRSRAIGLAAIRETFEETGLILGDKVDASTVKVPAEWRSFFDTGHAPALHDLEYIYRAITPPFRPIRFNARFFLAKGDTIKGKLSGNGELLNLRWLTIEKALNLPMPRIQEIVLKELTNLVDLQGNIRRPKHIYVVRMVNRKRVRDVE